MTARVGIFGGGGMARESRDIAEALGYSALFVVRSADEIDPCESASDWILESDVERYKDMPYVVGIGECKARERIAARYATKVLFGNLIHPEATFGAGQRRRIEGRKGAIVCAGVRITCNVEVGDFAIFNLNATVSHDCIVGDYATISPQACLLGNVALRERVWIGAGAILHQGKPEAKLVVGPDCIIGAGAVVLKSCEANSTYVGVPARRIK